MNRFINPSGLIHNFLLSSPNLTENLFEQDPTDLLDATVYTHLWSGDSPESAT